MFKVMIRGVEYIVKRVNRDRLLRGTYGDCTRRDVKEPTIQLVRGLRGKKLLNYTIHEAQHACLWDLDEEAVCDSAEAIAEILWKDGWRRSSPDIMK